MKTINFKNNSHLDKKQKAVAFFVIQDISGQPAYIREFFSLMEVLRGGIHIVVVVSMSEYVVVVMDLSPLPSKSVPSPSSRDGP